MPAVAKHARAKRDLVEHYVHLAEEAGNVVADRFLAHAEESFTELARHPEMGFALSPRSPRLAGIRKWRVKAFEKFLIFYLPRPGGIAIVRVLHAAQDWWSLFELP